MTEDQFYEFIETLHPRSKDKSLEEYLLSLYKILNDNKDVYTSLEVTFELIAGILDKSFTSEPQEFNEDWLSIVNPPNSSRIARKFTNPEFEFEVDKSIEYESLGMDYTLDVLRFQIADLHKMRDKQLKNEYRYFGVRSETGHQWYNFDPYMNLECGLRCMDDNDDVLENLNWSFIGEILEDGRIYE